MNCPTIDELSQYVDELLSKEEHTQISHHIKHCATCKQIVAALSEEQTFIKETLETPLLPNEFTQTVLDQLEPFKQRKRHPWKRVLLSAAGIVLAFGLSSALSPSFAEWVGGLFSTDQVDEGLRMAADAGFSERVNLAVEDQGITFKIEDIIADSSRVALSYQILKDGKPLDTYIEIDESNNKAIVIDPIGKRMEQLSMSWQDQSEYGLFEFSLREEKALEQVTIKFELTEIHGKHGNWELSIPVNLKNSLQYTTIHSFEDAKTDRQDVSIHMKEARFAPSSNELLYETRFTKEKLAQVEAEIQMLEEKFGEENVHTFSNFGTAIQYHIENEEQKTVYYHKPFNDDSLEDSGLLQGTGQGSEQLGQVLWNESFIPQENNRKLTFVLDGVVKTEPADFSITFKPKQLEKQPFSFEYEGNFLTVKEVKKTTDYSLRKSIIPIRKETIIEIGMEGSKLPYGSELDSWILVDEKGKAHIAYNSGSLLHEKDENGHYQTTVDLTIYNLDRIPEELTLHLLSVTRYEEVKDKWRVPLY